ncbi:Ring canal kelch protein [Nymphon striatum]|nr:Ring canal kelch protein [Nymphon striatum]
MDRSSQILRRPMATDPQTNKFYVFGGMNSNSCEYYCPQEDTWRPLLKMKEERCMPVVAMTTINLFMLLVSGYDWRNNIDLTSMERFDVEIGQWLTLKSSIGVGHEGRYNNTQHKEIVVGLEVIIRLEKGVRQGDSISPKIFTVCLENVFRCLNWTSKGIPINGHRLTNLRFADDVVLFSESPQELQLIVEELRTASNKVCLEINLSKTKVMFNRNVEIQPIMTGNVALDQVDRYTYLGQLISIHRDWEPEVRRRVALGWQAFGRLNNVWLQQVTSLLEAEGIRPMCPACTNVWVRDLGDYRYPVEKIGECQHSMERKILEKFQENPNLNKFEITGFKLENVNKIFDFFYSDSIIINKNDLNEIVRLAKLFQLDRVLDNVFNYIKDDLNLENVWSIRDFWMSCDKMEEVKICDQFIEKNFDEISKLKIFKVIEFNYLKLLMKSNNLVVPNEKRIYEIAIEWLNVDIQTRQQFGQQLMENVRFPLMPYEFLLQISGHEIIQNSKLIKRIMESVQYSNKKQFRIGQNILTRVDITPRKYGNIFDYIILIGGKGAMQSCSKYDLKNKTFIEFEPLPYPRFGHVATIINSELFICGGWYTKKSLISLKLNERNGKWRNRKSSLEDRSGSTGCSVNVRTLLDLKLIIFII